jgi:NADPH:quinone reductase-like Zn-dependent oxidoreductase
LLNYDEFISRRLLKVEPLLHRQLMPDEVRVAVRAVSLNYRDLLICRGEYPAPSGRSIIPCSDGSGAVLEVGSDVAGFMIGDSVVGSFFADWQEGPPTREKVAISTGCNLDGWLAEEVILPAKVLVNIPSGLSFTTAACAPCAGVTAWVALVELAKLTQGQTVLIQGTGGVSMWMAQLAKAHHLHVIFITSDAKKVDQFNDNILGVINYHEYPEWSKEVLRLTNGRGADLVLEVGGKSTIRESLRAVAFAGHIAIVGGLSGWTYDQVEYLELLTKLVTTHGIYVGSKRSLIDLLEFTAKNSITPYISARFTFQDALSAFREMEAGHHVGKIIIDIS